MRIVCMSWGHLIILLFLATAHSSLGQGSNNPYNMTVLTPPGSIQSTATGINDKGQIIGSYIDREQHRHAFIYDAGKFTTIDALGGKGITVLSGINNSGDIVGYHIDMTGSGDLYSFLYKNGVFQTINASAKNQDLYSICCINDKEEMAGIYYDSNNDVHAFTRTIDKTVSLKAPRSMNINGIGGINNAGTIVGTCMDVRGHQHGFVYKSAAFTVIDRPNADSTFLTGVNDSGAIVGWSAKDIKGTVVMSSFLLSDGKFIPIRCPGGFNSSQALAINNRRHVVGDFGNFVSHKYTSHGLLLTPK